MGFTPLQGRMMAIRSGSIDPGIVLHLQRRNGAARQEHNQARLAVGIYTHRVRQQSGLWR
jgi:acetate kinase